MKKIHIAVTASIIICLLLLAAYAKDINYIIGNKPCVKGTVTEAHNDFIVIDVNEDDELYRSYKSIVIPLAVKKDDTLTVFHIGDEVAVYYDGNILETHPAKINTVYQIR